MDISSRLGCYSKVTKLSRIQLTYKHSNSGHSSVQAENTPTVEEEQNTSSDSCVNEEHNAQTDRIASSPVNHQRRDSPHPCAARHHGRPDLIDLIQHSGGMGAFYTATRSTLWDSSCITQDLRNVNNIHYRDDGRMQQKQQSSSVAGCPLLLPSPRIQRTATVDHNDYAEVLGQVNEDISGWLGSESSISTKDKLEESETIAALESPCRPLAKQMSTPPPLPVSIPCTPSRSRPVKIPSTPYHNKGEDNNSFIHPNSLGFGLPTAHSASANARLCCLPSPKDILIPMMQNF